MSSLWPVTLLSLLNFYMKLTWGSQGTCKKVFYAGVAEIFSQDRAGAAIEELWGKEGHQFFHNDVFKTVGSSCPWSSLHTQEHTTPAELRCCEEPCGYPGRSTASSGTHQTLITEGWDRFWPAGPENNTNRCLQWLRTAPPPQATFPLDFHMSGILIQYLSYHDWHSNYAPARRQSPTTNTVISFLAINLFSVTEGHAFQTGHMWTLNVLCTLCLPWTILTFLPYNGISLQNF